MYIYFFLCVFISFLCKFISFYVLLFPFISIYFFLLLFISVYFFLFLFSGEKKENMILNVFFWFSDHPNHVVAYLLQPAPPLSLADNRF